MGDSMEVAFIVILIIIWVIRQIAAGIKKEAGQSESGDKPSLSKQLRRAFDEWSENIPSGEEDRGVDETAFESQPEEINCPSCGIRLAPGAEGWQEQQFSCPACGEWIDLGEFESTLGTTEETWSEETDSPQRIETERKSGTDTEKQEWSYSEELFEAERRSITEEKPIAEQRLEDTRKPEKRQPAEKTEPAQVLKKSKKDYYKPSGERREVLEFLKSGENTRQAFLVMELLQPPVSMRKDKSIWQDPEE